MSLPFPGVSWAAVTLACGSVTRSSVVALAFLGTILSKATLRAGLTTHCALNSKRLGKLDGPPARTVEGRERKQGQQKGRERFGEQGCEKIRLRAF